MLFKARHLHQILRLNERAGENYVNWINNLFINIFESFFTESCVIESLEVWLCYLQYIFYGIVNDCGIISDLLLFVNFCKKKYSNLLESSGPGLATLITGLHCTWFKQTFLWKPLKGSSCFPKKICQMTSSARARNTF